MATYNFAEMKVLIVDDNRHMRALLRELLKALGVAEIEEANDVMSAFRRMKQFTPDIIITDFLMQPVDGLQFSRMVRNEDHSPHPYVPIIMVTGYAEKARVEEARDAGVSEFLAKPVTTDALYARLEAIVEQPRPFVRTGTFFGPDRRRREMPAPLDGGRRLEDLERNDEINRPNVEKPLVPAGSGGADR